MTARVLSGADLMTGAEVAEKYKVTPGTISNWEREGYLPCVRTPGNHRRYRPEDVEAAIEAAVAQAAEDARRKKDGKPRRPRAAWVRMADAEKRLAALEERVATMEGRPHAPLSREQADQLHAAQARAQLANPTARYGS